MVDAKLNDIFTDIDQLVNDKKYEDVKEKLQEMKNDLRSLFNLQRDILPYMNTLSGLNTSINSNYEKLNSIFSVADDNTILKTIYKYTDKLNNDEFKQNIINNLNRIILAYQAKYVKNKNGVILNKITNYGISGLIKDLNDGSNHGRNNDETPQHAKLDANKYIIFPNVEEIIKDIGIPDNIDTGNVSFDRNGNIVYGNGEGNVVINKDRKSVV